MLKYQMQRTVEVSDWDDLVEKTYGRPYNFQQQDGRRGRGTYVLQVPADPSDFKNDTVPEIVNGEKEGVSLKAWLARDPKQPLTDPEESKFLKLWWFRNFYPTINSLANDLYAKGLIEAGEYTIIIDW